MPDMGLYEMTAPRATSVARRAESVAVRRCGITGIDNRISYARLGGAIGAGKGFGKCYRVSFRH